MAPRRHTQLGGMMLTRLTLVFSLCFASLATAGAWPREKGTLFIAAGGNFLLSDGAQLPVHYDPTVYAEYGLTDRVTIGLDLYTADAGQAYEAISLFYDFSSFDNSLHHDPNVDRDTRSNYQRYAHGC